MLTPAEEALAQALYRFRHEELTIGDMLTIIRARQLHDRAPDAVTSGTTDSAAGCESASLPIPGVQGHSLILTLSQGQCLLVGPVRSPQSRIALKRVAEAAGCLVDDVLPGCSAAEFATLVETHADRGSGGN